MKEPAGAGGTGRFVSVGTKLAAGTLVVIALLSSLVFVHISSREHEALVSSKQKAAAMVADLLAASLVAPLDFGDVDAVAKELGHVRQNPAVSYAAVWSADEAAAVASIGAAPSGFARPSEQAQSETVVREDHVVSVRPISGAEGRRVGTAVLLLSLADEQAAFASTRARLLGLVAALAGATVVLLVGLAHRLIVRPLDLLLVATQEVERKGPGARVDVRASDEVGRLGTAFNSMSAAVVDRERKLAEARDQLRELFDHMGQSILVFGRGGVVAGIYSKQAEELFGARAREGARVSDLLYPDAPEWDVEAKAFAEWLDLAFEVPLEAWSDVAALAPASVEVGGRGLALSFRPVAPDGAVDRVLLLATDETEKRTLLRTVEEQVVRHARQMTAMRRLVAGGGQLFVTFLEGTRSRLKRCSELAAGKPQEEELEEVFRHVHTIKGEARAFDLAELADALAAIEDRLQELRAGPPSTASSRDESWLVEGLAAAAKMVDAAERMFAEASPVGRAALDQVTVRRADIVRLEQLVAGRTDELARVASRLSSRPFGETVAPLLDKVPTWAASVGKRARAEVEGREQTVPPDVARVLGAMLTHLVRNAIAHGVEPLADRAAADKPEIALVRIACVAGADERPSFVVEDDGRGVAHDEELAAAARSGRPITRAAKRTSLPPATDLAGRGVGLAAVIAEARAVGYELAVSAQDGRGARFELRPAAKSAARAEAPT